uniref:Uncharacterized protein n=1 Tax=Aegilops tauschii subsp. strangulata TaxID=200361 RepID=A0A453CDB2_AEGTS
MGDGGARCVVSSLEAPPGGRLVLWVVCSSLEVGGWYLSSLCGLIAPSFRRLFRRLTLYYRSPSVSVVLLMCVCSDLWSCVVAAPDSRPTIALALG